MSEELAEAALDFGDAERPWDPFSPEAVWSSCPGHEWKRGLWDTKQREFHPGVGGADQSAEQVLLRQKRFQLVTRCDVCGAARCDTFGHVGSRKFAKLTDHGKQLYRCTLERHHDVGTDLGADEGHDYLVPPQ